VPVNLLIKCRDLEESMHFYSAILDFEVPDGTINTVRMAGCSLIFSSDIYPDVTPAFTGTMYFFIDDVQAYFERIRHRVEILWPLQRMSYGTYEFGIPDCNGYHLAFAQDKNANAVG